MISGREAVGAGRLVRLREWMANESVAAAYLTDPISIAYLTGVHVDPGERLMALALHSGGASLIAPAMFHEIAVLNAVDVGVVSWRDGEDPYVLVREALKGAGRVAVDKGHLTVRAAESLQAMAGTVELVDLGDEVRSLRRIKSAAELEKLRHAAAITDEVTEDILGRLRLGQSELEVATMIAASICTAGGTLSFESLVAFGPHAAMPHHTSSERRLEPGDLVLLDFGAAYDGYHADTTRMAVAGEPTERQLAIHTTVLEAHDAAITVARAGVTAGEVDAAARRVIAEAGHADDFIHRVGHGLGLEVHEDPSLDPGSATVLAAGMVATIEPGIYIPGWGGVRIEDDVVVEAHGCRLLTQSSRALRVVRA